jgi:hypothetical protein
MLTLIKEGENCVSQAQAEESWSGVSGLLRATYRSCSPKTIISYSVVDPHWIMRTPDPAFYVNADPFQDPGFDPKCIKKLQLKKNIMNY